MVWLVLCAISSQWSKNIYSQLNGYSGEEGPEYNISEEVDDWDEQSFGFLAGPAYNVPFSILLLFTGLLAEKVNRKIVLSLATISWSICVLLSSYATTYK